MTRSSTRSAPAGGGGVEGDRGGRAACVSARGTSCHGERGRGRARVSVARHPPPRNGGSDGTPSTGARCAPRGDREPRPLRRSHAAARSAASSGFSPRICARCASGRHAVVEPRRSARTRGHDTAHTRGAVHRGRRQLGSVRAERRVPNAAVVPSQHERISLTGGRVHADDALVRGERDAGAVRAHRRGEQAFRERGDGWELLERVEPVDVQRAVLLRDEQSRPVASDRRAEDAPLHPDHARLRPSSGQIRDRRVELGRRDDVTAVRRPAHRGDPPRGRSARAGPRRRLPARRGRSRRARRSRCGCRPG